MAVANFLHRVLVEVRPHDLLSDALVVWRAGNHAPATELSDEPLRIFELGIVAVALAEMHEELVLVLTTVSVVIVSLQPAQDDILVAVDVSSPRDDLALLGTVSHIIQPNTRLVQRLENG